MAGRVHRITGNYVRGFREWTVYRGYSSKGLHRLWGTGGLFPLGPIPSGYLTGG